MSFKVILINPNTPGSFRKASIPTANLGIAALSAYIKQHTAFEVEIIDARYNIYSPEDVYCLICKDSPDVIGVSLCVHESVEWANELLTLVKDKFPSVHVCLGNYFPSLFPAKALEQVPLADSIVVGEGEVTFLELLQALEKSANWKSTVGIAYKGSDKECHFNQRRKLIANLDDLPWPDRYLASGDGSDIEAEMEGTRGCGFSCNFCAVAPFYGLSTGSKLRIRSAKSILDEIQYLIKCYPKLESFRFADPDFISSVCKNRSQEFAELLIKNSMEIRYQVDTRAASIITNIPLLTLLKESGLVRIYLGIESGSQRLLDKMKKYTNAEDNLQAVKVLDEVGIDCTYSFMMVTPWSTEEDMEKNFTLIKQMGKIGIHNLFHEMTLIPGTEVFDEMKRAGRLIWKGHLYYYSYKTGSQRIENFREIRYKLEKGFPAFFANLSFIYESIRQIRWLGGKELAATVEDRANDLALNIFRYCWDNAVSCVASGDAYFDIAAACFNAFSAEVNNVITMIDPNIPIPCPADLLPARSPVCQV